MDLYLRSSSGVYICIEGGSVFATDEQAGYGALLAAEVYDPVRRAAAQDQTLRSNGLITLRSREGMLLAPQLFEGAGQLAISQSGLNIAPQLGYDVFRIFKVGGEKDEPIRFGDTVVLRFTPAGENPTAVWMTANTPGSITFTPVDRPGEAAYFTTLSPIDLVDFTAHYDDVINAIALQIQLSGPALPGGHVVQISSPDAPDLISTMDALIEESPANFALQLDPAVAGSITPCSPRRITLRISLPVTGRLREEPVKLEGDRAGFLAMKVEGVKKIKSALPVFKGQPVIEVTASLSLDPSIARVDASNLPLVVELSTPSPEITNLEQEDDVLSFDQPITFTFQVQQPEEDTPPICTLIAASYRLNREARESWFPTKISYKGIALDIPSQA